MNKEYFINEAFTNAIKLYIASSFDKEGITYNTFLVIVIRTLILIYGEASILNPYYLNDESAFYSNLTKYGFSNTSIALFSEEFLKFYNENIKNNKLKYQKPIPYFKTVIKYLIDMFILKKQNSKVTFAEEEEFLDLIYINESLDPYRYSYKYLMDSENYTEKYYYSKLNEFDVTKDLSNTINVNLNLDALNYMGIGLSNVKEMSKEELINAQNKAYSYFAIDSENVNRDDKLKEKLNNLKYGKPKLSTGNGYVDILLLMSIIVTVASITSILLIVF